MAEEGLTTDYFQSFVDQQCIRELLLPDDVARIVVFLASPLSDGITGQTLVVDNGWRFV